MLHSQQRWILILTGMLALSSVAGAQSADRPVVGRWLGQVAQDHVGPYSEVRPNGIQDIGIELDHLPVGRTITHAVMTGEGGSEWRYKGRYGPYAMALERPNEGAKARLFVEPDRVETGRMFFLKLDLDDGQTLDVFIRGGKADPRLRMPGAIVKGRFKGNTGEDLVGATPAVGPDGFQDAVIELTNLPTDTQVARVRISAGVTRWETGLNPEAYLNAELVLDPKDSTRGQVYIQPERTLRGNVDIEIHYANNAVDKLRIPVAAHAARRPVDAPRMVRFSPSRYIVQWHGQDGQSGGDRGDVHLAFSGLPHGRKVIAAGLSDAAGGYWAWKADEQVPLDISQWDRSLTLKQDEPGKLTLFFPAFRDEAGASMSLWLMFEGGYMTFTPFEGQSVDPFLRGEPPAETSVVARPGDDLHGLVDRYGTVELTSGIYALDRPLVLNQPVTIVGPSDAVLEFTQRGGGDPWRSAIKIHRSNTTLRGFTVRFATPIAWKRDHLFIPAVVGTSDRDEGDQRDPKWNVTIEYMRLWAPESADPSNLEESPRMLHLATAQSGKIIGNVLRGGITEFTNGPWIVTDNTYLGCPEGFWVWDTFATRWTHDVLIENNLVSPLPNSGKTWRFLVLAAHGWNNVVRNNRVENVGIHPDDTIPNPNAPEIALTEAYTVKFEGRPAAIRENGRILQLPLVHADQPRSGDAVTILTGEHAGKWFPVAQAIGPTVLLMDEPLPPGNYDISVATGFTNLVFEDNRIETAIGSTSVNVVFVGNHFGTIMRGNHLIGGGAFRIPSCPTERPNIWGWTHCPYVGDITEGNIFENSRGALLGVEYGKPIKTSRGRTYRSGLFRDNTFVYTEAFFQQHKPRLHDQAVIAAEFSDPGGLDPIDVVMTMEDNRVQLPPGHDGGAVIEIRNGTINEKPRSGTWMPLETVQPPR